MGGGYHLSLAHLRNEPRIRFFGVGQQDDGKECGSKCAQSVTGRMYPGSRTNFSQQAHEDVPRGKVSAQAYAGDSPIVSLAKRDLWYALA